MFGFDDILSGGVQLLGNFMQNSAAEERQQEAQVFNAQQSAITREFNAAEAEKQRMFAAGQADVSRQFTSDQAELLRQWQEKMSNSAYQRGTADMRAAGINPMVAYMQGGASTPVGGMGTSSPPSGAAASAGGSASTSAAPVTNLMQNVMSTAMERARLEPQVQNMVKTGKLIDEQANQAASAAFRETQQGRLAAQQRQNVENQNTIQENSDIPRSKLEGAKAAEVQNVFDAKYGWIFKLLSGGAEQLLPAAETAAKLAR